VPAQWLLWPWLIGALNAWLQTLRATNTPIYDGRPGEKARASIPYTHFADATERRKSPLEVTSFHHPYDPKQPVASDSFAAPILSSAQLAFAF
jgi:hypothetical protein